MNFLTGLKVVQTLLSFLDKLMEHLKSRELKGAGRTEEKLESTQEALTRNAKVKRIYADPNVDPRWVRRPGSWER